MKEIKITVPEGYEIDKENSTFECIKFKKKGLAYKDICHSLFSDKDTYYISTIGNIDHVVAKGDDVYCPNSATSEHQAEQLLAINKLMNVAAYLNEKPLDWGDASKGKWSIGFRRETDELCYLCSVGICELQVYFDSNEHARQAVEILGEDVVKTALGVFD